MSHPPLETSLLELIIETAPDAIITADSKGMIMSFSPAAERIFGYTEAEVKGQNLTCLMPEPYQSEHDEYMDHYARTGEKRIIGIGREVHARRKNGEVFVAELAVGEFVRDSTHFFTGFIRDVTDRVNAEGRAREFKQRLDRVSRIQMLGELSSALAHEINQPLTAIGNFAQAVSRALAEDNPDIPMLREQVQAIAAQSLRAGEIIRRMRRMVDRGTADIKPEDVNEIIEEAVQVGRTTSEFHGPEVELALDRSLPAVLADRIQIQQVIINLMNNAYEAVQDNAPAPIKITSARARKGRISLHVVVTVRDTGPGIPEDQIETIFTPLFTSKSNGLGVGLAVCRSIIDAHGGRIWAENTGQGAAFSFTLPMAEPTECASSASSRTPRPSRPRLRRCCEAGPSRRRSSPAARRFFRPTWRPTASCSTSACPAATGSRC